MRSVLRACRNKRNIDLAYTFKADGGLRANGGLVNTRNGTCGHQCTRRNFPAQLPQLFDQEGYSAEWTVESLWAAGLTDRYTIDHHRHGNLMQLRQLFKVDRWPDKQSKIIARVINLEKNKFCSS